LRLRPESYEALSRREAGRLLRSSRERAGLTQRELAAAVHVDLTLISKVETGAQPTGPANLTNIAAALNMTKGEENQLLALMGRIPPTMSVLERKALAGYYPGSGER
jgi:transcriptional regulator with XRE-family HTH domain